LPYKAVVNSTTITVSAVKVTLTITPIPPWTAGQSITLKATVTKNGAPYAGASVLFQWMNADTGWGDIGTATTDSSGVATRTWTVPWTWTGLTGTSTVPCKTNTARAIERASGVYGTSSGRVAYPTRLSITAPSTVAPGQSFTISGKLEYQDTPTTWKGIGANRKITLSYNTTKIADVYTASDGSYSYSTSIPTSGTYGLNAEYAGEGFTAAIALFGLSVEIPPELTPLAEYAAYAMAAVPVLAISGVIAYNELTHRR
jgi:hypothetical protein